jgi:hypothetical protein
MMLKIIEYLTNPWKLLADFGKSIALIAGISVMYFGWRTEQRAIGETKAVAKIEKATKDGLKKAESAARKSADPNAAGVRNPYYRD